MVWPVVSYVGRKVSLKKAFSYSLVFFPTVKGDPHFVRWQQTHRDDFQGECDLVLFKKSDFELNKDLAVHIRTTSLNSFSFIESSAVKVGQDVLEFAAGQKVYMNGGLLSFTGASHTFGPGYSVSMSTDSDNNERKVFLVELKTVTLKVKASKAFMTVSISGENFSLNGSVGLLGKYGSGAMVARDGRLVDEFLEFGFEWQVIPDQDGQLFQAAREPQLPYERCRMPDAEMPSRRKLLASNGLLYEQALDACNANHPENVDSCVNDVLLSGDLEFAESW